MNHKANTGDNADKYSLWFRPVGGAEQVLQQSVAKLAEAYGTELFQVHVTLLGNIERPLPEVVAKVKQITTELEPFELTLGAVDFSNTYFQCLFARIQTTATLMNAFDVTARMFDRDPQQFYMPHLSLVYGNFTMVDREKMAAVVTVPQVSFWVNQIEIIKSAPHPRDWQTVATVPLI